LRYALSSLPTPLGVLTFVLLLEQGCSGFQRGGRLCLELGFEGRGGLPSLAEQRVDVLDSILLSLDVPLDLLNPVSSRQAGGVGVKVTGTPSGRGESTLNIEGGWH
jgi:hypothetical protein